MQLTTRPACTSRLGGTLFVSTAALGETMSSRSDIGRSMSPV